MKNFLGQVFGFLGGEIQPLHGLSGHALPCLFCGARPRDDHLGDVGRGLARGALGKQGDVVQQGVVTLVANASDQGEGTCQGCPDDGFVIQPGNA